MATINNKQVKVSFNGINGYSLEDLDFTTPARVKEKIANAQKAIRELLDETNGENCEFMNKLFIETYKFSNFISYLVADQPTTRRYGDGTVETVDFSDVPFIREYDENFCVKNFTIED